MEVTGRGGRASPGKDNGVLGGGEEAAEVAHLVLQHLATKCRNLLRWILPCFKMVKYTLCSYL